MDESMVYKNTNPFQRFMSLIAILFLSALSSKIICYFIYVYARQFNYLKRRINRVYRLMLIFNSETRKVCVKITFPRCISVKYT